MKDADIMRLDAECVKEMALEDLRKISLFGTL